MELDVSQYTSLPALYLSCNHIPPQTLTVTLTLPLSLTLTLTATLTLTTSVRTDFLQCACSLLERIDVVLDSVL
jgi:hypothetical protein